MASPYSSVDITGYNSNPPADDGSQTEANRVKWATVKAKLNDPVKVRTDDMDAALIAAFDKIDSGITATAVNYTVLSSDQGKLVRATASGITITTPDATDVGSPFVFEVLNSSSGDITLDGSGSQTVDGAAAITLPAGCGLRVRTDGTNWYTSGQNFQRTQITPQGYLTLIAEATNALSPILASDVSAATSVYYRPFVGNLIPIPDGTNFSVFEFAELTLTLNSNHVASSIYDCFVWNDSGTIRLGTGPVWTTVTAGSGARGSGAGTTELQKLKGLYVNKNAITLRNGGTTYSVSAKCATYVGSIYIDGTNGQVTCHKSYGQNRKWGVWNTFNRRPISLKAGATGASWTYSSATVRQSNADTGNKLTTFSGLAEEITEITFEQTCGNQTVASGRTRIGIGLNSTTTISGTSGDARIAQTATATEVSSTAQYNLEPTIGINNLNCLEAAPTGSPAMDFNSTEQYMLLKANFMG